MDIVKSSLYPIMQRMSGVKYLYDWCIPAAIGVQEQYNGFPFTPEQRAELDALIRESLPKIGLFPSQKPHIPTH
jgi:hypothetical protein